MLAQVAGKVPFTFAVDVPSTMMTDSLGEEFHTRFVYREHHNLVTCDKFVAIVPLITTYALLPDVNALVLGGNRHIFDLIHPHVVDACAQGRCVLLFDASPEGDPFIEKAYEALHLWLDQRSISKRSVLITTQNRVLAKAYKDRFGDGVSILSYDAYIKRMLLALSRNGTEFTSIFGFPKSRLSFCTQLDKKATFLSMNGTPRSNRIVAAAGMLKAGILDDAIWSMLGGSSNKMDPSEEGARQFRTIHGLNWITDQDIENLLHLTPRFIEIEDFANFQIADANELAIQLSIDVFERSFASIVTETEFSDGGVRRITEKSIKPLAAGHPFVILGNPSSLPLIRELGFVTFGDFINEEYDDISDVGLRLNAALSATQQLREIKMRNERKEIEAIGNVCLENISVASNLAKTNYENIYDRGLIAALEQLLVGGLVVGECSLQ